MQEHCPDRVEFKELQEIAIISGAGVDKKVIKQEKPILLLNYMDVYRNKYIDKLTPTMEVTASDSKIKQCNILKGDIFFTPSSEVLNDIGNSALVVEDMEGVVYSYHIMRLRLKDPNFIFSMFINYIFQSSFLQNQINKNAKGITRYGLTKSQWEKIIIPIPPLPVQQEIVNILDKFTQLEEELNAELEARRKQYDFYLNQLMGFEDSEVEWKTLGEVAELKAGKSISAINISDIKDEEFKFKCIGGNGIRGYVKESSNFGDFPIIGRQGALCGNLFYATGKFYATEHAVVVKSNGLHNQRFLYYLLNYMNLNQYSTGGAQPGLAVRTLNKILIPIPPLSEQERIVSILDKFDALVNDATIGIQAEIDARRKQYEYYRNKLLTFKEFEEVG